MTLRVDIAVTPADGAPTVEVAFDAAPGVTILFGPSGAGKSTTLLAIAGLMRPERGRITLDDAAWFDAARGLDVRPDARGVSFVFQNLALFPHMTGVGNVEYGIDRSVPRHERRARAAEFLARMKVPHLAKRRPSTYSGGEAQRVALARAFARRPRVVLLDEAFSAMDRDLRRELLADVRRLVDEANIPAIMVTHHRMEARAMGDHVVTMASGRVTGQGTVEELLPRLPPAEDAFDQIDLTPVPLIGGKR